MISIPGTGLRRLSIRMNCNKPGCVPGSQTVSCPISAKGAPGGGMGVNVGRGANVEDATGTNAVWTNEVVGVVVVGGVAVVDMVASIIVCVDGVSVAIGSLVAVLVI